MRSLIKYVTYHIVPDETAEDEFRGLCVFGDEAECGAKSPPLTNAEVMEWMRKHVQATGHNRFLRTFGRYEVWTPAEPVPAPKPVLPS